jgi:Domain of unknown function (DUF6457)
VTELSTLDDWLATAAGELGVEAPGRDEVSAVLDLAKVVAHGVARPAAPVTAYLAGLAVGRGMPLAEVTAALERLVPAADQGADGRSVE